MEYKINNKPIEDFGLIPGRQSNSNIAIAGCWDMPARIGKVFHDWQDENGVEPYLREDEIFFGGRDISLYCWLSEGDRGTLLTKDYILVWIIGFESHGCKCRFDSCSLHKYFS